MNLNIETTEHENYYEIKVGGELDVYTAPQLQDVLQPIRQKERMIYMLIWRT